MEGWEAEAARGGGRRGDGEKDSLLAWESWKGEEVKATVDGLGVAKGVEAEGEVRAVVEVIALVDGDLGGATVDQESFDGAFGFRVSMYREEGVFRVGGGDGLRGGVALGLEFGSSMSLSL